MSPILNIEYLRSCKRVENLNVYHFQFITVVELKVENSTKQAGIFVHNMYKRYTVITIAYIQYTLRLTLIALDYIDHYYLYMVQDLVRWVEDRAFCIHTNYP
jgi:hypothetical protein